MMSEAWENYHRRAAAVHDVAVWLDRSRGDQPPWNPTLATAFESPGDLLVALHDLWSRRLLARVDMELENHHGPPAESVAIAWHATAATLPGVRRVLDAHIDHPALESSELSEHRLLAVAAGYAGLAQPVESAAREGRLLVAALRRSPGRTGVPTGAS